jgi:carnitine-CoA ligase
VTNTISVPAPTSIPRLLAQRLDADPDGPYLDVTGTTFTAATLANAVGAAAAGLTQLELQPGDRVATMLDNSAEAVVSWFAAVTSGWVAVPLNTANRGEYLRHQLVDSGASVLVVQHDLVDRVEAVAGGLPDLRHLVVVGAPIDGPGARQPADINVHRWDELIAGTGELKPTAPAPSALAGVIYTGGTTGPSKGCMLSHNYPIAMSHQIGVCWDRRADDVVWTPMPTFHLSALTTTVIGPLLFGGRAVIERRFSVSDFWPAMNRFGATIASTLGSMAFLIAGDADRPEMPGSGAPEANRTLRLIGAVPVPPELERRLRDRFDVKTFSNSYGSTEASLVTWQPPDVPARAGSAGIANNAYFEIRIVDDDDQPVPVDSEGEIVVRPNRPDVMFSGYWQRPEATVRVSRNWWFHTGDIGRLDADGYLYFLDRKDDYLRRRGENVSSTEVEGVVLRHEALAEVAVHAVPSPLGEDDLKLTVVARPGVAVDEEQLFRWCRNELPGYAVPRYIEVRTELPRNPVGRVLKRVLRDEAVTPATWDVEATPLGRRPASSTG